MITKLSLNYSDGFTSENISFNARMMGKFLFVKGSCFDPDSKLTAINFNYSTNIEELIEEVTRYVVLNREYRFSATDHHSVIVKYDCNRIQYSHYFYGIGSSLNKHFPELEELTMVLGQVVCDIRELIAVKRCI